MRYRNYEITHNPKPIPTSAFDWDYCHIDYDGAIDSKDQRCGSVASEDQAKQEIDAIEDESWFGEVVWLVRGKEDVSATIRKYEPVVLDGRRAWLGNCTATGIAYYFWAVDDDGICRSFRKA